MKGATDYEDKGNLKSPVNQVVAILPNEADLPKIIADPRNRRVTETAWRKLH
ncbi:MAG: hypothetical protein WAK31_02850 [Chthoniobacterales bacterium]